MDIRHLLTQSIAVSSLSSRSSYGDPSYAEPRTVAARVEWSVGEEDDGDRGEKATTTATLWTLERLSETDRVWLPHMGESSPRDEDIADMDKARRPSGEGVSPAVSLRGRTPDFYVTKV